MANETQITVVGNLTDDPSLRFIGSGDAVANFTVASTPRTYNRQSGEWEDGEPLFMRCSAWKQLAENISESAARGTRVVVQGRLKQRSFETREGEKRTVIELDVDELALSVKFGTASFSKAARSGGQQQRSGQGGGGRSWGGQSSGGQQEGYQEGSGWGRTARGGGGSWGGGRSGGGGGGQGGQGGADPWAAPPSNAERGYDEEPPF